ncbi:beta-galactosidase [Aestuariimicrobium kwangyangense]|uniref:beta-galactosidase n=1 Tax=Aestuariimicrobium kwangyangense TaxID=396389 RepID=UPI0003B4E0CA|nr:beta-galactosidase [Aestuariimicrobium kwangyangense]
MATTPPASPTPLSHLEGRILFGAAYYAEYQPQGIAAAVDRDLDLMVEAGFTVIRVGESVWSTWEPRPGEFDLDWLQPVLDGAHARGISVILGTPTYAVPPWLARLHPEIAAVHRDGTRAAWGARQEMDYSHPTFRRYAERVVRAIAARWADHPAVIGWQVDNEPSQQLPHNAHVIEGFREWLRGRYGTVEALNEAWGLVYWSHRLSEWADLWAPAGNAQPQHDLEWRRYSAELVTEFIGWQADLVREHARPDQFVTTCISYPRPGISDDQLVERLDVTAGNPYYRVQDGLSSAVDHAADAGWWTNGPSALFTQADRLWSSAQAPFLVTETDAQSIGGHADQYPPYPGQLLQAGTALVARGARMVEYWHWHTLHFGAETYWGGVIPHSGRPGRVYREVAELGRLLGRLGPALEGYRPDADAAVIWSTDSKWTFEFAGPLVSTGGVDGFTHPDRRAYERIVNGFVDGARAAGLQLTFLHDRQFVATDPSQWVERYPVLFAPAVYVADDDLLDRLRRYAEAGGHLVVGPRTGYADELARARQAVAPDRLWQAAGVWYEEYSTLPEPVAVTGTWDDQAGTETTLGRATKWADGLLPGAPTGLEGESAEVLAGYQHPFLGSFAAVTTREHGRGRITVVGTIPDLALGAKVARFAQPSPIAEAWHAPSQITVTSGTSTTHQRIWFVHNWSWDEVTLSLPTDLEEVTDLADGSTLTAGDELVLGPWAVRVLGEPRG